MGIWNGKQTLVMCAYAYTQLLPTWKQRLERTNQPWQGVGHYFNHQSMMCGKAACRAINRQIQEPSHPNFWRPWWGKLPLKDAPSLRNERWEQPESYRQDEHEGRPEELGEDREGRLAHNISEVRKRDTATRLTALASQRRRFRRKARLSLHTRSF